MNKWNKIFIIILFTLISFLVNANNNLRKIIFPSKYVTIHIPSQNKNDSIFLNETDIYRFKNNSYFFNKHLNVAYTISKKYELNKKQATRIKKLILIKIKHSKQVKKDLEHSIFVPNYILSFENEEDVIAYILLRNAGRKFEFQIIFGKGNRKYLRFIIDKKKTDDITIFFKNLKLRF
jgi:hypothetical protein